MAAAPGPSRTSGTRGTGAAVSGVRAGGLRPTRDTKAAGRENNANSATKASFSDLDSGKRVSVILTGYQGHLLVDPGFFLFHVGYKLLILQGLLQPLTPSYRTHRTPAISIFQFQF